MRHPTTILTEIYQIEAAVDRGERGTLTALKAAHRKLCAEYRRAQKALPASPTEALKLVEG